MTLKAINPECIFHVGANSNTMETDINTMMAENFDFTYGLALWCSENNVPLIYSSSASVYGNYDGNMNLYAWSKYSAEAVVLMMGGVALRYFNVYGPRQRPDSPYSGVVARWCAAASRNETCTIFGDGHQTREFVAVH
ncbi:MAG: NAD-dependent epimerase/dehydratase family protein, partial [bacterium]